MAQVPTVAWTERHLEELEKMFPELVDTIDSNKLLVNNGKRTVVAYVRQQVKNRRTLYD